MLFLLSSLASGASCVEVAEVEGLKVDIDFVKSSVSEVWTVTFDPAGCTWSDVLPAGIEGAKVADERLLDDGRKLVQLRRLALLSGNGSGSLDPWRASAEHTRVRFRAPASVPLQVFTDDSAHQYARKGELEVWWSKGTQQAPSLIWTSWSDWVQAGRTLQRPVQSLIPSVAELGSMGRSLKNAEVSTLVDRLDRSIDLVEGTAQGWDRGRPIGDVLATGEGTASERGRILLGMLKAAGHDARVAWFTPEDDPALPRTLPAPHLLLYPAVAVVDGAEIAYVDPGTVGSRPPEVPARMRGGRVLVAGRHLAVPLDTGAPRGEVRIDAELEVRASGQIGVVAHVHPSGAAEQVLRSHLVGRDAPEWPEIVGRWITAREGIRDLVVDVKGLDGRVPLRIDVRFTEPVKLQGAGRAFRGPIRDLLAPGLAGLLPPGIALEERLNVRSPAGVMALTAVRPPPHESESILLNRSLAADGPDLVLSSDWRVVGARTPEQELLALPKDTEVLLFPSDATARKEAKRLELPALDLKVIDAMLLWRLGQVEKARKVLDKLHPKKVDVSSLADLITRYVSPGDRRPWEALIQLVETDEERLEVIDRLVETGDRRLAWQLATFMAKHSPDNLTRARAFVQIARFQGPERPDVRSDPDGYRAWKEPTKLLQKASRLAGNRQDIVQLELARAYLRNGTPMEAAELLDDAMEQPTGLTKAIRAEFGAITGLYGIDVLGLVDEAIAESPFDPDVREATGRALAELGRRRMGVADILLSAELAGNDTTRWMTAAGLAADFGDLRAAVFAARRASDLEPNGLVQAVRLQLFAKLARDARSLEVAIERSDGNDLFGEVGDSLEELLQLAADQRPGLEDEPSPWELALLRHHTVDVEADKALLLRRAELHFDRAMMEDAALDGSLLLDRYRSSDGARFTLGGVTGRFRHASPTSLVRNHGRSPEVVEAQVDLALATGGRLKTAGRRRTLLRTLRSNPERVAQEATTWPVAMRDFEYDAPEGFQENRLLSGIQGVKAWSDPVRQMTVLVTEKSTGALPPPFANLYENGPTVLSTGRGAAVIRLEGGAIPLYAGITLVDGRDVFGIGLSPAAARDALLYGIGALELPEG